MGMHEYGVDLSTAKTPEDMKFVEQAFIAGRDTERIRILKDLEDIAGGYDTLSIALFKLRNIINGKDGISS